jgi:hypothetical protein
VDEVEWPESWAGEFDIIRATAERGDFSPGEAAAGAYRCLAARAACPWRAVVAKWPDERRGAWGLLAGTLQDAGEHWREAERRAFIELTGASDGQ